MEQEDGIRCMAVILAHAFGHTYSSLDDDEKERYYTAASKVVDQSLEIAMDPMKSEELLGEYNE